MNKCEICQTDTSNKHYCSLHCRDISRNRTAMETRYCENCKQLFETNCRRPAKYCSTYCANSDKNVIATKKETAIKTNLQRYGVEYPSQSEEIKKKLVDSNLSKYGVEHTFQRDAVKDKIKVTNLERYGVEFAQQSDTIKEKTKTTVTQNYGGYTFASPELSVKAKETIIEKYGVDNAMKSDYIKGKTVKTNLERYETEWALANLDIRHKINETIKRKYGDGITNISQVDMVRSKIQKTNLKSAYITVLNRIPNAITPLFTEVDFCGVGYYDALHKFRCNDCGAEFETYLYGGNIPICRVCYPTLSGCSKAEVEIGNFLENELGITIKRNVRDVIQPLELDIWIEDKQVAIEFNGLYWHSELSGGKGKTYHLNKTELCEASEIRLIHIFEDEWLIKQDIVKARLSHILGKSNSKIYARQCIIKQIDAATANVFLQNTHIQGKDKSSIRYGAFFDNKLVAVMTFGKQRIALGNRTAVDGVFEMIRFAVGETSVVGIANKLFSQFARDFAPKTVISYADRRWTNIDNVYSAMGFSLISKGTPNYWYVGAGSFNREHRYNYRKSSLSKRLRKFDDTRSEWANMQNNGYDRIWDCGSLKYVWETK